MIIVILIRNPKNREESEKYRIANDNIPWVLTIIIAKYIPSILAYLFNYIDIFIMKLFINIFYTPSIFYIIYT